MHSWIFHNGRIVDSSQTVLSPGQVGLLSGWGVFSTIRVFDGVLFAYERHWARMRRDAAVLSVPFPADSEQFKQDLLRLVEANGAYNGTLRVSVIRNRGGMWEGAGVERDFDVVAFTANVRPWVDGVRLGVVPQGRHAQSMFAGTKVLSWCANVYWYEQAHRKGLDEVMLLNERGEVSECTSANLFAVEGSQVWTPPLASGCLPGVTREVLLDEIRPEGMQIGERTLLPGDLEAADEIFITSTVGHVPPQRDHRIAPGGYSRHPKGADGASHGPGPRRG
ncbi:MAG: aminotransferase class IV [Acidobacteria bacterium]|nr:aminotransferase class IV [Acidobacteriota bacterium]